MEKIKRFEDFEKIDEKWKWWITAGIATNLLYNVFLTKPQTERERIKQAFEEAPVIDEPRLIRLAKNKVKEKVLSSDLENKDSIIKAIDNIKIIETPDIMKNSDDRGADPGYLDARDMFLNNEYIIINTKEIEHLGDQFKLTALTHELFHLVDAHKADRQKPNIVVDSTISERDFKSIFSDILNVNSDKRDKMLKADFFHGKYKKVLQYRTCSKEIYARINNLKLFLFDIGKIKNPNESISSEIWKQIYNGTLASSLNSRQYERFYKSDFVEVLPFLRKANLDEINKLAYNPNTYYNNLA